MTNDISDGGLIHPHPLMYAYNVQKRIRAHESALIKLHTELSDVIKFCMESDIVRQDGYELGYDDDMCLVVTKLRKS